MAKWVFGFLLLAAVLMTAQAALDNAKVKRLQKKLRDVKIFPDIIDEFAPETEMKITFNENRMIELGTEATPEELINRPHMWFRNTSDTAQYTMILFDADAEVPFVKHWIAVNVDGLRPASDFKDNTTLHQYVPYHGPTPPADNKKHRYVFMLYEQPENSQVMRPVLEDPHASRAFFDVKAFAKENNLRPVGISYMLVEHQQGFEGEFRRNNVDFFNTALPYSMQLAASMSAKANLASASAGVSAMTSSASAMASSASVMASSASVMASEASAMASEVSAMASSASALS